MGLRETVISREDLADLLEYSCSLPTGVYIGKRWRRDTHFGKRKDPEPEWMIGEYVEDGPEHATIRWSWAVSEPGRVHRGKLPPGKL